MSIATLAGLAAQQQHNIYADLPDSQKADSATGANRHLATPLARVATDPGADVLEYRPVVPTRGYRLVLDRLVGTWMPPAFALGPSMRFWTLFQRGTSELAPPRPQQFVNTNPDPVPPYQSGYSDYLN